MNDKNSISAERIQHIISLIDLTNLNDDCDQAAIETLCTQASTPFGCVAAICIWPSFVSLAKQCLGHDSPIQIATVVNFPSGDEATDKTGSMIETAISDGATEIDYVLPYRTLVGGDTDQVVSAIQTVRAVIPQSILLKVILETGELNGSELIRSAAIIAIDQGADFIKTSTGKVPVNATPNAAIVMLDAIVEKQKNIGFKAAGGIKSVSDADIYLKLAEERLGQNWPNPTHFRFGASSLLQDAVGLLDSSDSDKTKRSPIGQNEEY